MKTETKKTFREEWKRKDRQTKFIGWTGLKFRLKYGIQTAHSLIIMCFIQLNILWFMIHGL